MYFLNVRRPNTRILSHNNSFTIHFKVMFLEQLMYVDEELFFSIKKIWEKISSKQLLKRLKTKSAISKPQKRASTIYLKYFLRKISFSQILFSVFWKILPITFDNVFLITDLFGGFLQKVQFTKSQHSTFKKKIYAGQLTHM